MQINFNNSVVIGAGRVALSLVHSLSAHSIKPKWVFSRSLESARRLAEGYCIEQYSDTVTELTHAPDFIFICVPDDAIEKEAHKLASIALDFKNSIVLHFSGALNSDALSYLKVRGAKTASFHIMRNFSTYEAVPLTGYTVAIESGEPIALENLKELALLVGLKPIILTKEQKTLYHAMAVYVSNFLVASVFNAQTIFNKLSLDAKFEEIVKPIVESSVAAIFEKGVNAALSGPVERGDKLTIAKHIQALAEENLPRDVSRFYDAATSSLVRYMTERGGDESGIYSEIEKLVTFNNQIRSNQ